MKKVLIAMLFLCFGATAFSQVKHRHHKMHHRHHHRTHHTPMTHTPH